MEGESNNRGATRACSECKKNIASRIKCIGVASLEIYCPNPACNSRQKISMGQKLSVSIVTVTAFVIVFISSTSAIYARKAGRAVSCVMFTTQEEAQKVFDLDPVKYGALDADNDKKACESLPKENKS